MMARQQSNRGKTSTNKAEHPRKRERAVEAYDNARERAIEAYGNSRERARESLEGSPLLALGGGLALGALIAALLPKTETEDRLLGDVGGRINDAARSATEAAKSAGRERLSELNITREAGKGAVQNLIDGFTEAARSSGKAAVGAVRNKG
jgi:hypothetical protein